MSRHARSRVEDRVAGRAAAAAAEVEDALSARLDPAAAAFFDVDNTVMRGASIFHFARALYAHKFFTMTDIWRFGWKQLRFIVLGESLHHMEKVREQALSFVAGHSVAELSVIGEEAYDEVMVHKIWPGTRAMAAMHLDAGQRVWLVTATPVEVADVIAQRLGLTGALGTVAESVDGVYTGRLVGEALHGPAKAEAVRALAEREGLDLARCSAYSDSAHDIPMLSLVGRPVVVNPDGRLRRYAQQHGWQVRDYRTGRRALRYSVRMATRAAGGVLAGTAAVLLVQALRRRMS